LFVALSWHLLAAHSPSFSALLFLPVPQPFIPECSPTPAQPAAAQLQPDPVTRLNLAATHLNHSGFAVSVPTVNPPLTVPASCRTLPLGRAQDACHHDDLMQHRETSWPQRRQNGSYPQLMTKLNSEKIPNQSSKSSSMMISSWFSVRGRSPTHLHSLSPIKRLPHRPLDYFSPTAAWAQARADAPLLQLSLRRANPREGISGFPSTVSEGTKVENHRRPRTTSPEVNRSASLSPAIAAALHRLRLAKKSFPHHRGLIRANLTKNWPP
jgi:hypothetical protein